MKKTDWVEILTFYNSVFKTKYTKPRTMLKEGYKKFKSIKEFALKIGVSDETLRLQLWKEKIKVTPSGKWKRKTWLNSREKQTEKQTEKQMPY
jgi:transposase